MSATSLASSRSGLSDDARSVESGSVGSNDTGLMRPQQPELHPKVSQSWWWLGMLCRMVSILCLAAWQLLAWSASQSPLLSTDKGATDSGMVRMQSGCVVLNRGLVKQGAAGCLWWLLSWLLICATLCPAGGWHALEERAADAAAPV